MDKYRESFARHRPSSFSTRSRTVRPPIHLQEKLLLGVLASLLIFLPWALGGVHNWAGYVALALSLVALVVALIPRVYQEQEGPDFKLVMWPKLFRFPVFWLGLAFFAYAGVQIANPAWTMMRASTGAWWMQGVPFISWLPHGVGGIPDELISPWISLLGRLSAFFVVCAAWVGITRRRSIVFLLNTLAINATLVACFALVQRLLGLKAIYGFWQTKVVYFVGPFIYKNHAGAYFNLMIAVAAALTIYYYLRTARLMEKSTPSAVFVFMSLIMGAVVFISYSRGATFLLLIYVAVLAVFAAIERLRNPKKSHHPVVRLSLLGLLAVFLWVGFTSLKLEKTWERAQALFEQEHFSAVEARSIATEATLEMATDSPWFGHGQGSFRFVFPAYQIRHPEILGSNNGQVKMFWAHAHNDYVEAFAELGVVGLLPLLAIAGVWVVYLLQRNFWRHPPVWVLILGLLVTAVHCSFDFQSYNPAIFLSWCLLWPLAVRWLEIEERQ